MKIQKDGVMFIKILLISVVIPLCASEFNEEDVERDSPLLKPISLFKPTIPSHTQAIHIRSQFIKHPDTLINIRLYYTGIGFLVVDQLNRICVVKKQNTDEMLYQIKAKKLQELLQHSYLYISNYPNDDYYINVQFHPLGISYDPGTLFFDEQNFIGFTKK